MVFLYALVRGGRVGATYDEIITIQDFCSLSFYDVILGVCPVANNHVLNTILIKVCFLVFGESLFVARIPNLLSLVLYLYFGYRISYANLSRCMGISCYFMLICNPFLLDFFSLARGYGLSLAFMAGSLYFASENAKLFSLSNLSKSLLWGGLSVLSLFSMIYFWAALVAAANLEAFLYGGLLRLKDSLYRSLLVSAGVASVILVPLWRLVSGGGLIYGGDNNFYSDTLLSLARRSLASPSATLSVRITLNALLIIFVISLFMACLRGRFLRPLRSSFLYITLISVFLIILSHFTSGILYPLDRGGLFIYPLFVFCLFFSLESVNRFFKKAVVSTLVVGLSFNFLLNFNIYKTILWDFDSRTTEILAFINNKGMVEGRVVDLQFEWVFEKSLNYYINSREYPFVHLVYQVGDDPINPSADFYLSRNSFSNSSKIRYQRDREIADCYDKKVLLDYPGENIVVLESLKRRASVP